MIPFPKRLIGPAVYGAASLLGAVALTYPLWRPVAAASPDGAHASDAPILLAALIGFALAGMVVEVGSGLGPRAVAVLGWLVAANSVLRYLDIALPLPGGFSPVFLLIVLVGYALGSRFGFLLGVLTFAVSAVVTAGVGPWLPYQMLAAGWVGAAAGWLPGAGHTNKSPATRREVAGLAVFGAATGFAYGMVMTLWFWPYIDPLAAGGQGGGTGLGQVASAGATLARFGAFYLVTSAWWDVSGAIGNAALIGLAGPRLLNVLRRFGERLTATWEEGPDPVQAQAAGYSPNRTFPVHSSVAEGPVSTPAGARSGGQPSAGRGQPSAGRGHPSVGRGHPHAWLIWLMAVLLLAGGTRNPFVLMLLLGIVALVRAEVGRRQLAAGEDGKGLPVGRVAALMLPVAVLYNFLAAHSGATVLARLPAAWPVIGGPLTLEAMIYGLATGLGLVVLLAAFDTFQRALPRRELVRLVPSGFGPFALCVAIALTYVPAMQALVVQVREAQAVRGDRGGWRSAARLGVPVLVGGLERALSLAETLTARGLARPAPIGAGAGAALAVAPAALLVGWLGPLAGWIPTWVGAVAMGAGLGLGSSVLVVLGRRRPVSRLRPLAWRRSDALVAAGALGAVAGALFLPAARETMHYLAYPRADWPNLSWWLTVVIGGLLAPVTSWRRSGSGAGAHPAGEERWGRSPLIYRGLAASLRGFGFRYPGAAGDALTGVALDLAPGSFTLVVGPSGSGKSTLLRTLAGLVPYESGGAARGSALLKWGPDDGDGSGSPSTAEEARRSASARPLWTPAHPGLLGEVVGWVPGDPEASFVVDRVADEVAFALEQRGVATSEILERVAAALSAVGMAAFADRSIESLSGGERQRVAVAAALALRPGLLILDEPTSQLDDEAADQVLRYVAELARGRQTTVVMSEHRLERVWPLADQAIAFQKRGVPPRVGAPSAMADALPIGRAPSPPGLSLGRPVLELRGVSFQYVSARRTGAGESAGLEDAAPAGVGDLGLTVRAGEIVALTGPSGAGKTTLLRLAVGLLRPTAGDVLVAGKAIAGCEVADVCRQVAYLPQDPAALLTSETVMEELMLTLAAHELRAEGEHDPLKILATLGAAELAGCYPRDLSTGQRQRVALAAVAVTRPPLWLLDEPTRGLDDLAIGALAELLHDEARRGTGILIATHDRRLVRATHRVVRLEAGCVVV